MEKEFQIPEFLLEEEKEDKTHQEADQPKEEELGKEVEKKSTEEEPSEEPNFLPNFNYQKDNGFFELLGEELKEPETAEEYFELVEQRNEKLHDSMIQDIADGFIEQFPEYLRPLMEAAKHNPVTEEEFIQLHQAAKPSEITEESLKNEEVASKYLTEQYSNLGHSQEEIEDLIDKAKDSKELTTRAVKLLQVENQYKKNFVKSYVDGSEQMKKQQELEQEQYEQNVVSSIKGLGWRADQTKLIEEEFTSGNFEKRLNHIISNPKVFPHLINFMAFYDGKELDLVKYNKYNNIKGAKQKKQINEYFSKTPHSSTPTTVNNNDGLDDLFTGGFDPVTK